MLTCILSTYPGKLNSLMPWGVECSLGVNLGHIIQAYTKMCMKTLIQGFKDALIFSGYGKAQ